MVLHSAYVDLSCPFSFALFEQFIARNKASDVAWKLIEHAPDSTVYNTSPESQAELARDVYTVRRRAPNVSVALPPLRCDSRFATLCVIAAQELNPEKAIQLIRSLFMAMWQKGKDISATAVIYDCIVAAGLDGELSIEERHEVTLAVWQDEWENGDREPRAPLLIHSSGQPALDGFADDEQLDCFLQGKPIPSAIIRDDQLHSKRRQIIALYGHSSIESGWSVVSPIRDEFDVLLPVSPIEIKNLLREQGHMPDLIILNAVDHFQEVMAEAAEIAQMAAESHTPVALIGDPISDQDEARVYETGAADYLIRGRAPAITRARIRTLLKLKRSHDLLERAARYDGLTQTFNRREFERCLEVEWLRGHRSGKTMSLILIDVDHFKDYNDNYGHLSGDGTLQHVASAIKDTAKRAQDAVCRYGGEEFVVLLPETDQQGAEVLAEKIRLAIADLGIEHSHSKVADHITASLGIASRLPSIKDDPHTLVEAADKALYQAKEQGRNQACVAADAPETIA